MKFEYFWLVVGILVASGKRQKGLNKVSAQEEAFNERGYGREGVAVQEEAFNGERVASNSILSQNRDETINKERKDEEIQHNDKDTNQIASRSFRLEIQDHENITEEIDNHGSELEILAKAGNMGKSVPHLGKENQDNKIDINQIASRSFQVEIQDHENITEEETGNTARELEILTKAGKMDKSEKAKDNKTDSSHKVSKSCKEKLQDKKNNVKRLDNAGTTMETLFTYSDVSPIINSHLEGTEVRQNYSDGLLLSRIRRNAQRRTSILCTSPSLTCSNRCVNSKDPGGAKKEIRCFCDSYCNYFKDCCYDYAMKCLSKTHAAPDSTSKIPDEQWSCRNAIWMITSCPDSWKDHDTRMACTRNNKMTHENYADSIPVITPDNKTFANRVCSRCHGYQENQLTYYPVDIKCTISPPQHATHRDKMKFIFSKCRISPILPKDGTARRYCSAVEKPSCSSSAASSVTSNCINGSYNLIHVRYGMNIKVTFKNAFCAMCNGVTKTFRCGPGRLPKTDKNENTAAKPFALILDVGTKNGNAPLFMSCSQKSHVYDSYLQTCRKGVQVVPGVSDLKRFRVAMWMKAVGSLAQYGLQLDDNYFVAAIARYLVINETTVNVVDMVVLDLRNNIYLVIFDVDINDKQVNITDLFKLSKTPKVAFRIGPILTIVDKVTVKPLTCVAADTYSPLQYQVLTGQSNVYINITGEVLDQRDYFSTNTTMIHGYAQPVGPIVVCRQMLPGNCTGTYIFLEKHEYVMYLNRSLLYKAASRLYEYEEYTVKNGSVMICTNFTTTYKTFKKDNSSIVNDTALSILTSIGFSISIICLVFVLVTYALFAKLRTIPGINLMNLSSALLVANLLWLVGSGLTADWKVCTGIAIVLHYSFLASFMWMSIIAFDTWRAFSRKPRRVTGNSAARKRKRVAISMSLGWIPLVVFVSVCVALDQSNVVTIGYGGEKGCWINNSWANLYIFAIPVALSLIWNATFFVLFVKTLRKSREQSKLVASQHQSRQDSAIFARIAALMGFTWVFGFLAPFTTIYLMYPFVIFNTLQGLYIAMAFGCTRRVRSMYRGIISTTSTTKDTSRQAKYAGTLESEL